MIHLAVGALGGIISFFLGKGVIQMNGANLQGENRYFSIGSGVVGALVFTCLSRAYGGGELLSLICLSILLIASALTDIQGKLIPNAVIIVGIILGFVALGINPSLKPVEGLLGLLVLGSCFIALALITQEGLGMGDAKLIACMGLFIGLWEGLAAVLFATAFSGILGLGLIVIKGEGKKTTIPFAPFLLAGTMVVLLMK